MIRFFIRLVVAIVVILAAVPWVKSGHYFPMQIGFWATLAGLLFVVWHRIGRLMLIGMGTAFAFFVSVDSLFPEPEFTPFSFQDWVVSGLRYVLPWALIIGGFLAIFLPAKRKPKTKIKYVERPEDKSQVLNESICL